MAERQESALPKAAAAATKKTADRLHGVVIGILLGFDDNGAPLVAFPGNPQETALKARATTELQDTDIGREVALLFEGGDPCLPLVIGAIQHPGRQTDEQSTPFYADIDGERIVLSAEKEIVLKCGKSSVTLTKAGKVLLRGTYLLSRSSGVNRIKGGSVQIN